MAILRRHLKYTRHLFLGEFYAIRFLCCSVFEIMFISVFVLFPS